MLGIQVKGIHLLLDQARKETESPKYILLSFDLQTLRNPIRNRTVWDTAIRDHPKLNPFQEHLEPPFSVVKSGTVETENPDEKTDHRGLILYP
jgi:hypothetical protein